MESAMHALRQGGETITRRRPPVNRMMRGIVMNTLEFRLINEYQRGFPLVPEPFEWIAGELATSETNVLDMFRRLRADGAMSRIGAVFPPNTVGSSTLAAMAVPRERLEEVAALVSGQPEVNHNYEREHRYNLWFVVTGPDQAAVDEVLSRIQKQSGCRVLAMPMVREFHIDLGFDLQGGAKSAGAHGGARQRFNGQEPRKLNRKEQALMGALQAGLKLVRRPYLHLGAKADMGEAEVLETLQRWVVEGVVKRFGVVVRHLELGYTANAMVVWDIPDQRVAEFAEQLAVEPAVSLCYERRRALPYWPYNLYCMIHGSDRQSVQEEVDALNATLGLTAFPTHTLFSCRRFKQQGAAYVASQQAVP